MSGIPGRQMMLKEILVNPSVPAEDELRLSKQAMKIYELLRGRKLWGGLVSNVEMAEIAKQYNARVYEIRHAIEPLGLTVALVKKEPKGLNWYGIELKG